ncbi:MAG TPA: hypothetical protein VJJ21_00135 [Candidatus Nanoarchaeia archaeon]|nr:hypothetical protein [Candidatus Nanoarchaeia archaeon]
MEKSKRLVKGCSLGLQTHTSDYPLGWVVKSEDDLKILKEIFDGRRTKYSVLEISLPELLGEDFVDEVEVQRVREGLDVFLVYDRNGKFLESLNGKKDRFREVY